MAELDDRITSIGEGLPVGFDFERTFFERVFSLQCHTPLIHFQPGQTGATLRATEVKPKLDRFLYRRVEKIPAEWRVGQTQALNYKLRFAAQGRQVPCTLGNKPYDIFYGNLGKGHEKEGIKGDVKMTVICTIPALMTAIEKHIRAFFLVTNFGTMQGKGFGSYTVEGPRPNMREVGRELVREYGASNCYFFTYKGVPFPTIKRLYTRMKSGVSYGERFPSVLFACAGEELHLDNEKAWMKRNGIAPGKQTSVQRDVPAAGGGGQKKVRYIRALLGVAPNLKFGKENINVQCEEGGIARCPSPVFFKLINGVVYCVARRIPEELYGAKFSFKNTVGFGPRKGAEGSLSVPTEEDLGGADFIDRFLEYCTRQPDPKQSDGKMLRQISL